jgi:hypothetical protein
MSRTRCWMYVNPYSLDMNPHVRSLGR